MSQDRIIERAYMQIEAGDFDSALEVSERLIAKGVLAGFEIKTLALMELNEVESALAVAEAAVERWPNEWRLYNSLGTALLRAERHREALLAFRHAQTLDTEHNPELHLNLAIACMADDDYEAALQALEGNEEWGEFEVPRLSMQLATLVTLERWDDILEFTGGFIDEMGDDLIEVYGEGMAASLHGAQSLAILHGKQQARRALELAWDALRIYPKEDLALTTIREAADKISPFAHVFALECEVTTAEEDVFTCQYVVVADTTAEALAYVATFEGNLSGGKVRVLASEDAGPEPEEYCGIIEVIDMEGDGDDGDGY